MTPEQGLLLLAIAFVGTHFLFSHPLRSPLSQMFGEQGFRALYSIAALVTFGAMIWRYHSIGREAPIWVAGNAAWMAASLLMWFASILLVGSFMRNPAFPGAPPPRGGAAGVFRITRHPMMWSFAIWAIVHMVLVATPKAIVLDGAILVLALAGAVAQDAKKRHLMGDQWRDWAHGTSFVPFARGPAWPGLIAAAGGTILFLAATWLHPIPAGIWRWIS